MVFVKLVGLTESDIDLFIAYVRKYRGVELSFYRKTFLARRLQGRFEAVGVVNILGYIKVLKSDPDEWGRFIDKLSINVSEFFRDWEVFKLFRDQCVSALIASKIKRGSRQVRCWSCGCSCGEEAYSLAILFREVLKEKIDGFFIKIHATDVDEGALEIARAGAYERKSLVNCSRMGEEVLRKYFTFSPSGKYVVKDELKSMVDFQRHNLLTDKPLDRLDVIFFRNVQIYFSKDKVDDILVKIYQGLNKGGFLVLGKVEVVGAPLRSLLEMVGPASKVFRKA
jgi:chemotaxis methyl-accepting protein methylase